MKLVKRREKFRRGDIVWVKKKLPPSMSHFRSNAKAVVLGSYHDQYGGREDEDFKTYRIRFFSDGRSAARYPESALVFREHGSEDLIATLESRLYRQK